MIKVLTVRQPWAWLIVSGHKTIENRTWQTKYRGPLYIHAGLRMHDIPLSDIERMFRIKIDPASLQFGAVIGRVQLVDIVTRSRSRWFDGPFGWVFTDAEPLASTPMLGRQGIYDISLRRFSGHP